MLGGGCKTRTAEQPCAALKRSALSPRIQDLRQTCVDGKKLLMTDSGLPGIRSFTARVKLPNRTQAPPRQPPLRLRETMLRHRKK